MAEYPKCDFCSAPYPAWNHPSADFIMAEGWASADGAWAACETCHELIVAEDKTALANRALRTVPGGVPRHMRTQLLKKINQMHAGFWQNRNGEPTRQGGLTVDDAQHRLGKKPIQVNISKKNLKLLKEEAKRQGKTLEQYMDEIGEAALRRMFEAYDAVVKPQDGQHR